MSIKSGFFNSIEGDRTYNANDLNMIYAGVRTNGVIEGRLSGMKVVSNPNLTVDIAPGVAIVNDKWCHNSSAYNIAVEAGGTLARIDGVFLKLDETEREIVPVLIKGTESSSPVKPTPSNNPNTTYLALAYISVPAGTTTGTLTVEDARVYSKINSAPRVVLWENPTPEDTFGAQNVTLAESIDLFDTLSVELRTGEEMTGKSGQFQQISSYKTDASNNKVWTDILTRNYTAQGTSLSFSTCEKTEFGIIEEGQTLSEGDWQACSSVKVQNNILIPYRVFGVNRK